jgi:hypothetical protein
MFRFSRDKRFLNRVSFTEFMAAVNTLVALTRATKPSATVELLTCEDTDTYMYSLVTFASDEVTEALKKRKSYALGNFTKEIWERSMSISLVLKDPGDPEPFMICLSCDKLGEAWSLNFYGQCAAQELCESVRQNFGRPSFFWSIGDGYSKPSAFNLAFGQRVTGISLS